MWSKRNASMVVDSEPDIRLPQIFETTVIQRNGPSSIKALVVPAGAIPSDSLINSSLYTRLNLRKVIDIDASNLSSIVASMLIPEDGESSDYKADEVSAVARNIGISVFSPSDFDFAKHVTSQRLIPFQSSPLTERSLQDLISTEGDKESVASLVIIDSAVSDNESIPLLLVSRPDGFLILGAGRSLRRAVQLGLWRRLYRFLRGEEDNE